LPDWKLLCIVADMETIYPEPDPQQAAADLDAVADARRAVRDRRWPLWLYPTNALLLGALALAGLVDSSMLATFILLPLGVALARFNYWAGRRMGTPFAVPTSRGFRVLVALSGLCVLLSVFARAADLPWLIIACAVAAVISYGAGAALHHRSTRP